MIYVILLLDSAKIDGLILTNTTISRQNLYSKPIKNSWKIDETGGLSGPPLRNLSNQIINKVYKKTKGKLVLIGVVGYHLVKMHLKKFLWVVI